MKVSVLGGGPSGMFAAWAALQCGHKVTIYDKNAKDISVGANHGVFALWDDCDLFLSQRVKVQIGIIGAKQLSPDGIAQAYSNKVYGDPHQSVSVSKYARYEKRECFNHAEAYTQILEFVGKENVKDLNLTSLYDDGNWKNADKIICTLPANLMFPSFKWRKTEAYIHHSTSPLEESFMIYNVNEYVPWYRCSAIFGYFSMEYAMVPDWTGKPFVKVNKVLESEQSPEDCYAGDNVYFTGRFGAWQKEMLTEDVYWDCIRLFSDRQARNYIPTTAGSATALA